MEVETKNPGGLCCFCCCDQNEDTEGRGSANQTEPGQTIVRQPGSSSPDDANERTPLINSNSKQEYNTDDPREPQPSSSLPEADLQGSGNYPHHEEGPQVSKPGSRAADKPVSPLESKPIQNSPESKKTAGDADLVVLDSPVTEHPLAMGSKQETESAGSQEVDLQVTEAKPEATTENAANEIPVDATQEDKSIERGENLDKHENDERNSFIEGTTAEADTTNESSITNEAETTTEGDATTESEVVLEDSTAEEDVKEAETSKIGDTSKEGDTSKGHTSTEGDTSKGDTSTEEDISKVGDASKGDTSIEEDISKEGDASKGDTSIEEDISKEGDTSTEADTSKEGDTATEEDNSKEGETSIEEDISKEGDTTREGDTSKEEDDSTEDGVKSQT